MNPVGVWKEVGDCWNKKFDNIYIAGSESSEIWNGYMEGAILSAERVVKEILSE